MALAALAGVTVLVVAVDALVGLPGGVLHGRLLDGGASAGAPSAEPSGFPPIPASTAPPVLTATSDVGPADPDAVAAALTPVLADPDIGPHLGAAVVDLASGKVVYADGATTGRPPASTVKLLTATAAIEQIGGDTRLRTRVVLTPVSAEGDPRGIPQIVLVGGGDPSLRTGPGDGDPSLRALAKATARALDEAGPHRVRLAYDDSLFSGPRRSPAWPEEYLTSGVVGLVTALSVDEGRGPDPSAAAASTFATELRRTGVKVVGGLASIRASTDAAELAEVRSRPLAVLVERMLTDSDNDYAEAFGHLTALASGRPGTFKAAAAATIESLQQLGLPTDGIQLQDASGLSRGDRAPARTLALALALAGSHGHPELAPVLTGLPVAHFTGTLEDRFAAPDSAAGAGLVRAKTGTLSGIASLAGTVPDRAGRVLAFAFLVDRRTQGDAVGAPAVLDQAATALATCRCG